MNKTDERRIITYETIQKELKRGIKTEIWFKLFEFFCYTVIYGAIIAVFYGVYTMAPQFIAVPIFLLVAFCYPIIYFANNAVRISKEYKTVHSGGFTVTEDCLRKICEGESETSVFLKDTAFYSSRNTYPVTAYYFEKNGRATCISRRVGNYSVKGDIFYLVIYNKDSKIVKAYNSKIYRYVDDKNC